MQMVDVRFFGQKRKSITLEYSPGSGRLRRTVGFRELSHF